MVRFVRVFIAAILSMFFVLLIINDKTQQIDLTVKARNQLHIICMHGFIILSIWQFFSRKISTPRKAVFILCILSYLFFNLLYVYEFWVLHIIIGTLFSALSYCILITPLPAFLRSAICFKYIVSTLFVMILILPGILIAAKYKEVAQKEHSFQMWCFDFPQWFVSELSDGTLADWTNQIRLKKELIRYYNFALYKLGASGRPDKCVIGKDGWMFSATTVKEYKYNSSVFTEKALTHFKSNMEKRKTHLGNFMYMLLPLQI